MALLEKLQTAEGQKLLGALVERLAPHATSASGLLEPGELKSLPADRFEAALVHNVFGRFLREGELRDGTVAALADELSRLGGPGGRVDLGAVQRALGPQGLRFVQQLAAVDGKSGDPLADRRALDPLSPELAAKVAQGSSIAPPMPALQTMLRQIARKDELKGFQFAGLQHLFASSATLFGAIAGLGVKHDDMRLLGKVYSTNFRVVAELESRGAHVHQTSKKVRGADFATAMEGAIEEQLRALVDKLPQPTVHTADGPRFATPPKPCVLLIDDGAEAIKLLHEKFPAHAPFFVCVEQTRRGARILHELAEQGALKCPVVNVAETWAKLEWESPMIGHSVVLEVGRKLDRLASFGVPPPKESLVLGCGAVGGGVARAMLRRGLDVHLYDKDPARALALQQALRDEGFDAGRVHVHTDKASALAHGAVLVSCVGARTLDTGDHDHLPDGAVLVNAASADDELGPQDLLPFRKDDATVDERGNLWSVFRGHAINTGKADAEAHSDGVVHHPNGKEFLVVNHGYVVNMTGERDPIPARYIQLTRALLLLGGIAAKRAAEGEGGGVGVHDVPREWQEALVHLVQRELKKTGEDLRAPSWEKQPADAPPPEEVLVAPADVVRQAEAERIARPPPRHARQLAAMDAQLASSAPTNASTKTPSPPPTAGLIRASDGDHGAGFVDADHVIGAGGGATGTMFGFRLGPAAAGSREWLIARQMGTGSTLTLDGAALYAASTAAAAVLGAQLRVSLAPPGQQTVSPFSEKSRVSPLTATTVRGADDTSTRTRFAETWGHHCRNLVTSVLAGRLQRAPTAAEVAARLRVVFGPSAAVDPRPFLASLERSSMPEDQELRRLLEPRP